MTRQGWLAGRGADSSGPVVRRWPLVALAVVEAAQELTVLLRGRATFGELDDVIGLTTLGRFVAVGVLALLVPQLDGPAGGPGEEARRDAALAPPARGEHGPLDVGLVQPGQQGAWGDHGAPLGQLADAARKGRVVDQDTEEGGRPAPVGRRRGRPGGHLDQGIGPA